MTILWINLAFVFIFAFFSRYFAVVPISQNSIEFIRPNKFYIIGALVCIVSVAGLRENIGDTYFYKYAYTENTINWEYVKSQKDIGFGILQMILKHYTNDPQYLIFITALITNALILMVFYKYSRIIELSIYVYITSGLFLTTMNGIRQCLAAAIVFSATKYLVQGRWKPFFLIVLIASLFHETALILLPIFFIVRRRAWSKVTIILLLMAVLIVLGFNQFTEVLFASLKNTPYEEYQTFSEGGANIIRVIVDAAPLIIAFFGREKLKEIMPNSDYIINLSFLSLIFMIISTQNWIFARFSIYFDLYQIILISWIIKVFKDSNQRFIYFTIIVCYFLFHYYESVITLNIVYKSNFLDGII